MATSNRLYVVEVIRSEAEEQRRCDRAPVKPKDALPAPMVFEDEEAANHKCDDMQRMFPRNTYRVGIFERVL